jgi:membrane-associated phospholipid phosphatase
VGLPLSALRGASVALPKTSVRVPWRAVGFAALLVVYVLLTLAVVFKSPVLSLDSTLRNLQLRERHPGWKPWIYYYVMFGQRGPATLVFLPYFVWVSWRKRTTAPLVMLGTSLVLLNVSVGIVKVATGRLSPLRTHNAHDLFVGGNIYPSGHVSNTVVLYGLVAWIALSHRKLAIWAAIVLSLTVGAGTIYLDTHWLSDVVGGWIAGGLVLLALPTAMPTAQRGTDAVIAWTRRRLARRRSEAGRPASVSRVPANSSRAQRVSGPARSAAASHRFATTIASVDAMDERTRCG